MLRLYKAKCEDLQIPAYQVQMHRFTELCRKVCINRRLSFPEMGIGCSFVTELKNILKNPENHRIAKLDLHKNNL